jgi:hypothetical protein
MQRKHITSWTLRIAIAAVLATAPMPTKASLDAGWSLFESDEGKMGYPFGTYFGSSGSTSWGLSSIPAFDGYVYHSGHLVMEFDNCYFIANAYRDGAGTGSITKYGSCTGYAYGVWVWTGAPGESPATSARMVLDTDGLVGVYGRVKVGTGATAEGGSVAGAIAKASAEQDDDLFGIVEKGAFAEGSYSITDGANPNFTTDFYGSSDLNIIVDSSGVSGGVASYSAQAYYVVEADDVYYASAGTYALAGVVSQTLSASASLIIEAGSSDSDEFVSAESLGGARF